ncbi:lysozyme inhibitor LprI family protein [Rossellomorea vietnamensis]|uniref:lysozyme inhibitor LprI family protein n=1 Tax=Rossellomorea vietnamensis TaxID=218284 RepID=UPI003CF47009
MKNKSIMIIFLGLLFVLITACGNSSEESNTAQDNGNSTSSSAQNETQNSPDTSTDEDSGQDISSNDRSTEENEQQTGTDESENEESAKSTEENQASEQTKKEYLDKLNAMEEEDKHAEAKDTMVEMEEQEQERFEKWDDALNEIYGVLQEQLGKEEMEKLREEQRDWVQQRDEEAKKASLKYEGGTTESLEYIATQASLTKERAYFLVAHYMK